MGGSKIHAPNENYDKFESLHYILSRQKICGLRTNIFIDDLLIFANKIDDF